MSTNPTFLSPVQMSALHAVKHWLDNETETKQVFRLFGYAGSGKSTLAQYIAQLVNGDAMFLTFTGKAASVLRQKGCEDAQTLHSAIYKRFINSEGQSRFIWNNESDILNAELVILDECSMVDEYLMGDLLRFGVPVLAMGDPAQLPPIRRDEDECAPATPDVLLTEIHRQAKGNPILEMATTIRTGGTLSAGLYGSSRVIPDYHLTAEDFLSADQIIVGSNRKRFEFNHLVRKLRNYHGEIPNIGERLVCLRNHDKLGISNGEIFTVLTSPAVCGDDATFEVLADDDTQLRIEVTISIKQFTSHSATNDNSPGRKPEFDFGYALTCHKAQGSQWPNVLVFDDSQYFREDAKRWLYTAITRAEAVLTVAI